ncbi:MAG: beta-ketoacyl-ACP synthase III [Armatimonadota bacterium]
MDVRGAKVVGLGSYVPERILTNKELETMVDTTDEWIVSHTGMKERHIAAPDQATSDLAYEAGRAALEDSGLSPADLDMVIVATVTPDMPFPVVSSLIQARLGASSAGAFDVGVGCTGFLYALAAGASMVQSGMANHVLVVAAETLSRVVDWTDRSTCVLFGDGAGAVVLGPGEPGEGIKAFSMISDGSNWQYLKIAAGGSRKPVTPEAILAHETCLYMEGHEVFKLAVRGCPEVSEAVMQKAGLTHDDIDWAIFHQANRRIVEAAAKRLDIPDERVVCDVEKYGNTSASTIPLAMDDLYKAGKLKTGDNILLASFGAGFSLAGALLQWTK